MIEKIKISNEEKEIVVKPITLIFKSADFIDEIKYKRVPIDIQATLYHIERVKVLHSRTIELLLECFEGRKDFKIPDLPSEEISEYIRKQGMGIKHLTGLLDLTLKFIDMKVPFAWVHPESGLHPAVQANLADVIIKLSKESNENGNV